jgi:hypothetical protein
MISIEWGAPRSSGFSAAIHEAAIGYAIAPVGGRTAQRLPVPARRMIEDARNQLVFSVTSIWEVDQIRAWAQRFSCRRAAPPPRPVGQRL